MDIVFNIIDNIIPNTMIIITVIFEEKYNISIGKDDNNLTLYFYDSDKREVIKFFKPYLRTDPKYIHIKKYILEQIENSRMLSIRGFSNTENKKYLSKYFLVTPNQLSDSIIDINKLFT